MKKLIFLITIFTFICGICLLNNSADLDLWHRLAVGKTFFNTGSLLSHDIFAYTPTKNNWIDHEWGSGVIFYYLTRFFGDYGLIALKIAIFSLIILFIFLTVNLLNREKDNYKPVYFILTVIAVSPGLISTLRSQAFTYLFFALWLYLLEKIRHKEKVSLWIFPLTFVLWANLHGGFLAGLGLIMLYAFGKIINKKSPQKFLSIFAVTLPFSLINPWGVKFWGYLLPAVLMPRPYITEWKALNPFGSIYNVFGLKVFLIIVLFTILYKLFFSKFKKIDAAELLLILFIGILAVKSIRHSVFFGITASVFIYKYFYESVEEAFKNHILKIKNVLSPKSLNMANFAKNYSTYIFLLGISLNLIFTAPHYIKLPQKTYPLESIEFIKINKLSGNLLVPFNWGSYALWKLYPQCFVSIDGRYEEVYSDEVYNEYMDFYYAKKDWKVILKKYRTDIILIEKNRQAFKNVSRLQNFRLVFKDKTSAVFVHKDLIRKKYLIPSDKINYAKEKYQTEI